MTTFEDFARSHGLILSHAIADGAWHRVATQDHQRKRNGAYVFHGDYGHLQNWATMAEPVLWQSDAPIMGDMKRVAAVIRSNLPQRQAQERARNEATRLLGSAERRTHPYLAAKGFPALHGLVEPSSGDLLIPMRDCRDYSVVNSVQRIAADGSKKFLHGGKAKGSVFAISQKFLLNYDPVWLVEGYATGLSVKAALDSMHQKDGVIVCFSAGNLEYVATMMRGCYRVSVFADRDESGRGEQAAKATGLPYCMWGEIGDANDCHQAQGVRAVARLMLELMQQ